MKILYVHGLGGGKESQTGQWLKKYCVNDTVYAPDIPFNPKEAINFILDFCNKNNIDLLVGHSLGGFYSMCIGSLAKILINPAMRASEDLMSIGFGTFPYHSVRENGDTEFTITEEFLKALKKEEDFFYSDVDYEIRVENFAVFGTNDELFSHIEDFKKVFRKEPVICGSLHSLTEEEFKDYVLPLIEKIRTEYYGDKK